LQRSRVALIGQLPTVRDALVLGDGDGRFLRAFCRSQPDARVDSVDFSSRMLRLQAKRLAVSVPSGDVSFHRADARRLEFAAGTFDLLVCNFFLDCFTEADLRELLPRWLGWLKPAGWFYFSDFTIPREGWWRYKSAVDQRLMHGLFRWQTALPNRRLPDFDSLLEDQPLVLRSSASGLIPMLMCRLYRYVGA
jgi:ubiquinone/menaquinone biosynthesis C-methylase UbiE